MPFSVICEGCELKRTFVEDRRIGEGPVELLLIGEAPGKTEDEQGIAFVGRAGQILDKALAKVELDNHSLVITNAVHCWPHDENDENRTPVKAEMEKCYPHLTECIRSMKPKLIVTMGATAHSAFYVGRKRGTAPKFTDALNCITYDENFETYVMASYHPAALLYRASLAPAFVNQLAKAKRFLDGEHDPKKEHTKTYIVGKDVSPERFMETIREAKVIACDTECTGLSPVEDSIIGIGFSWEPGTAFYVEAKNLNPGSLFMEHLKQIFEDPKYKIVFHSHKFDAPRIERLFSESN